ncbi:hypothetical protein PAXRUDRAFT_169752, partial [Paxillus rubicundulus Ve08.2h10]
KCGVTNTPTIEFVGNEVTESDIFADQDDAELAEILGDEEEKHEDTLGQATHNAEVTNTLRNKAIRDMHECGVEISQTENKEALGIFPKVAGLAKKVHDLTTIGEQFAVLRAANKNHLQGNKEALDRRVPTRWNSDLACLDAHLYFCVMVQQLTGVSELKAFCLTQDQWPLATVLADVLSLLNDPTKLFSHAEVPLIPSAVPMLTTIENILRNVSNDTTVASVIHVAAHAGVLLSEKYYNIMEECEVYWISIVMSPDKKLHWFRVNGHSFEVIVIARLCTFIVAQWTENYCPPTVVTMQTPLLASQPSVSPKVLHIMNSLSFLITVHFPLAPAHAGCHCMPRR